MRFDIETYIKEHLSDVKKSSTGELNASCPWCGKSGHFYINKDTGKFICFKCDERGRNPVGLVAQLEGISRGQAARFIMKQAVQFRRRETQESLAERVAALRGRKLAEVNGRVDVSLPKEFKPVFKDGKYRMPVYLKKRGIKRVTAKAWALGWCHKGRFGGRVVIPIDCPNGRSFTARDTTGEQMPKYLNPKGANHARLLLGWDNHDAKGDVVLVEGPLDAIKLWQHGIPALAVLGHVLHSEQLRLLFKRSMDAAITVMLDPEEVVAPYVVASQLTCHFDRVYVAKLPDGIDPGGSTSTQAHQAHDGAVKYDGDRTAHLGGVVAGSRTKLAEIYQ